VIETLALALAVPAGGRLNAWEYVTRLVLVSMMPLAVIEAVGAHWGVIVHFMPVQVTSVFWFVLTRGVMVEKTAWPAVSLRSNVGGGGFESATGYFVS